MFVKLLPSLHFKGNNAREITRINFYLGQLIVTEKQKGKHAFTGIQL